MKARLVRLAGRRLSTEGVLLIDSRAHRTQAQNRAEARERLAELVRQAAVRPKRRRKTRAPKRAARRGGSSQVTPQPLKAGRGRARDSD